MILMFLLLEGLSLEDGANTLTDFTVSIIGSSINLLLKNEKKNLKKF